MPDDTKLPDPPEREPRTALYASKDEPVVIRPHVYDGIHEYDQRLPNWWLFTFYVMIVLFVLFWAGYYQFGFFKSDPERIDAAMAAVERKKQAELEKLLADLDNRSLVADWSHNESVLDSGQAAYSTHCSACHAADLSATTVVAGMDPIPMPGLPLTDGEWKFGGEPMEIFKLIRNGSPPESEGHNGAKMEAWGETLSSKAIAEITAFIISRNRDEFTKFVN